MLAGGLALLLGFWLVRHAISSIKQVRGFLARAVQTQGEVVKLVRHGISRSRWPQVRFLPQDGAVIEFTGAVGTNWPAYKVGDTVRVIYDPRQPSDARIHSLSQLWTGSILAGYVGGSFVLGGIYILFTRLTD